jgi:hypothetical protein
LLTLNICHNSSNDQIGEKLIAHRRRSIDGQTHHPAFSDVVAATLNNYEAHQSGPNQPEEPQHMSPLLSPRPPPTLIGGESSRLSLDGDDGGKLMGNRVAEPACMSCFVVSGINTERTHSAGLYRHIYSDLVRRHLHDGRTTESLRVPSQMFRATRQVYAFFSTTTW